MIFFPVIVIAIQLSDLVETFINQRDVPLFPAVRSQQHSVSIHISTQHAIAVPLHTKILYETACIVMPERYTGTGIICLQSQFIRKYPDGRFAPAATRE